MLWNDPAYIAVFIESLVSFQGCTTKTDLGGGAWNVRKALEKLPIDQLGVEFLVEWVGIDPAQRAAALADVVGAPVGQATELHGALLEHFGCLRRWQLVLWFSR
jgi:hypothetical protein